jgi:hypothetical protein
LENFFEPSGASAPTPRVCCTGTKAKGDVQYRYF